MNPSLAPAAVLLVALSGSFCLGQNTPTPQPLPKDPVALLQLASQVNGLHGDDLKPWHLHATWSVIDTQGRKDQGTYEEWWAGEKKYTTVVISGKARQTTWVTATGRFSQTAGHIPVLWPHVAFLIRRPIPAFASAGPQRMHPALVLSPIQESGTTFTCVVQAVTENGHVLRETTGEKTGEPLVVRYCFDGNLPAIRIWATPAAVTTYNSLVRFQGQYLARSVHESMRTGQKNDIEIDLVEKLDSINESAFTPPPDARLISEPRVIASPVVIADRRISGADPVYPPEAANMRTDKTVILQARILKDGTVGAVSVLSGPSAFRQAAIDAVKTWRYDPLLIEDEPVEADTHIEVVFKPRH